MKTFRFAKVLAAGFALLGAVTAAQAWHLSGRVLCDENGNLQLDANDKAVTGAVVVVTSGTGSFSATTAVAADGSFSIAVPDTPQTYVISVQPSSLPTGSSLLLPGGSTYAVALTHAVQQFEQADFLVLCSEEPGEPGEPGEEGEGVRTPGYWKNHPEAWPVETITIGGVTYTQAEAIALLRGGGKDKALTLFQHLLATRLNLLAGNSGSCITDTVDAADAWLEQFPVGSGVTGGSAAWKTAEPWKDRLDAYNNGELCAPKGD